MRCAKTFLAGRSSSLRGCNNCCGLRASTGRLRLQAVWSALSTETFACRLFSLTSSRRLMVLSSISVFMTLVVRPINCVPKVTLLPIAKTWAFCSQKLSGICNFGAMVVVLVSIRCCSLVMLLSIPATVRIGIFLGEVILFLLFLSEK